ncbi:hypothetical protein CY35_08G026200 [Sphagnum magellanicum]|nr:hypothetical protein CY35_08G026200 [Sphagnum magellanicum]KAH9553701.1 hypothetical protein CY35_08G026200 [Sphagnum magellanicum]KAH9553702.1 hypothetical protein CY35_08G026200 [Sphagnum magellanicum]KAH9553703.1 hypothetical protein CY35_08G026200 [Sphagnum magellanicum]KAH9553715.1 hypothetical protein CY35_08G026200 [Sphagnum magellanicum]
MEMPHKPKVDGVERSTWCINPWQWRNTVTRSVTYVLVAFLVCETIGNHFVQASTSTPYQVGNKFIPGAMWTNMLNGIINSTGLEDAYQQWALSVSIAVGDSIEFNYEEGAHTVCLLSNSADFAACNTASGVTVSNGTPPTIYVVKPTDPSTLYFICTVDSHCLDGQKVAIDIKGTGSTPVSSPVATPSGSAGNHLHHSLEMVPLLLAITSYLIFLGHLQ